MVTKEVTLPGGVAVVLRRPGIIAARKIRAMQAVLPPDDEGAQFDINCEMVCASCVTVNGKEIMPDTIDDHLDHVDFLELVEAVSEFNEAVADNTDPTSSTGSA